MANSNSALSAISLTGTDKTDGTDSLPNPALGQMPSSSAPPGKRKAQPGQQGNNHILLMPPVENPVVRALREAGLYQSPLGKGRHAIQCPWQAEHPNGVGYRTAYVEPDGPRPLGGFYCKHPHADPYSIGDLLDFLGVESSAAHMLPIIRAVRGEVHRVVDAAERSLAEAGGYFQRAGLVVTVITDPGTLETRIQELKQAALLRALSRTAVWERFNAHAQAWERCDPPSRYVAVLFDSSAYPHLPALNGLARQPFLRPDGSLCRTAGYDPATGLLGVFDAQRYPVPEHPTRAQAETALAKLQWVLTEFAFLSASDRSAALCALLTAAIRPSLPTAPMFHVRARQIGSGKSYLCSLVAALATAQPGNPTTFPADDEETRKVLLAELLRGAAVIEFDNLVDDLLPHKSLCSSLTAEFLSGRILGVSKMATVSTRTLMLSSGNNVGPIADMARRCITIDLEPACETPATRTFQRPDLLQEVRGKREPFVTAALTIIRAWVVAGCPCMPSQPIASFGQWNAWCRQPLLWLGLADPATSLFAAMQEDPIRETLGRLLALWQQLFGRQPTMARDLIRTMQVAGPLADDLKELLGEIVGDHDVANARKLGRWLRRQEGRIVHGLKLGQASVKRNVECWQVESVMSVSSVDLPPNLQTDS